tara:strand:- start:10748 stop:11605 length:858 start_codon:yes stop_codon:yes gene_type:complete
MTTNKEKIPSILPNLSWQMEKEYKFRVPFNMNGMKALQIHTTRPNSDELIWANTRGHKYSRLPYTIHLKDVTFGVLPKNSKNIIWLGKTKTLDSNLIQAFCFKGTSIDIDVYEKTYDPYTKYTPFQLNKLVIDRHIQASLWRLVASYKQSGKWDEMRNIIKYIQDVRSRTTMNSMWKILTCGLHYRDFCVPNPALSLRLTVPHKHETEEHLFDFLFTNSIQTERQTLTKWVNKSKKSNIINVIDRSLDERWSEDMEAEASGFFQDNRSASAMADDMAERLNHGSF